jgi:hypothetical protein
MTSLHQSREDVLRVRERNHLLEEANSIIVKEWTDKLSSHGAIEVGELQHKLQEIANKTFASVRMFMENKKNGQNLDIEKVRKQWVEIQ